jgi:hypothetical protein
MTFDLEKILQSKREYRDHLRSLPIAQKLAMLDALRERTLAIHSARSSSTGGHHPLKETPLPYRTRTPK